MKFQGKDRKIGGKNEICSSPAFAQCLHLAGGIQDPAAGFPVHGFDPVVAHLERMPFRYCVDDAPGFLSAKEVFL